MPLIALNSGGHRRHQDFGHAIRFLADDAAR
jgi:hypothetical protein